MMKYLCILILSICLYSCQDVIDVDSSYEGDDVVIDAWLKNDGSSQYIELYKAQGYYDNSPYTPIADAEVTIKNKAKQFNFQYSAGKYVYDKLEKFGSVGDTLDLVVKIENHIYTASSVINRVPSIDSIVIFEDDFGPGSDDGLYAELYARDIKGVGDTYWLRTYKNDTLLNNPQELVVIYDAGFDPGASGLDGQTFIRPLRLSVNPFGDDDFSDPYEIGDKIHVELLSISTEAFQFLQTVREQATNGDNTIFSLPVYNAVSNISAEEDSPDMLGFFNVSEVSSYEIIVK